MIKRDLIRHNLIKRKTLRVRILGVALAIPFFVISLLDAPFLAIPFLIAPLLIVHATVASAAPSFSNSDIQNGLNAVSSNRLNPVNPVSPVNPSGRQLIKNFTFRMRAEPETLDWNKAHTPVEAYLLMNLMEGLVSLEAGSSATPALAEKWTISPDGKTYRFTLRSNVKWSDGEPLKAQDFVYSWKRLLSPLTASSYAYLLFDIEGAESFNKGKLTEFNDVGIKAVGPSILQVTLVHPVAHWIYVPGFWVTFPLRQDIVEKYGNAWEKPGKMVNLGPFSIVSHDINSKFILKANPYYYRAHGNVDQITALIVPDDNTALTLYEAGQLDFLSDISAIDLNRISGRPDLKKFSHLKTEYLAFVVDKYPLSNVKVRRAIAMAIDKLSLTDALYGDQQPAQSFLPPGMMAFSQNVGLPYDPVRAKLELQNAGIDLSSSLKIEFVLPNWDKSMALARLIQKDLKKNLDIDVVLQTFDNKAYRNQVDLATFPMFNSSWTADYPDPDNFMSVFNSDSGNSHTQWKNKTFDQLVEKARQMRNPADREKTYLALQMLLLQDEAAIIPLYYEPNLALVRPRAKNFELNPLDYLYLRMVDIVP